MRSKIFLLVFVIASVISFRLSAQDAMFYFKYADKGDKEAMCRLGDCYLRGEGGVEQNLTAALNWYVKAAKKGYPEGLFLAAYCYFYGIGTSESFLINGYGYLTKAVKKEYIPAYWLLAQYYKSSKLNSLYLSNLRKSAEANYAHGQAEYGALYLYGSNELGVNQDISRGLSWIKKAAENNNALGLYYWAICYEAGSGMEANLAKALEYYEKSAQLGNAEAQARVGYAYLSGEMGDVDYATAYQYFTAAAEQNNAYAYGKIGDMHYYGLGTEENNSKAKEMYEAAVNLGDTHSMCQLAYMHGNGIGVSQNYDLMYQYYKEAADKNDTNGQCGMGDCYFYGYGVRQNESVGVEWYKKSAKQNNTVALYRLAYCYCNGKGIEKNKTLFLMTLEKAANLDYTPAKSALGNEYYLGDNIISGTNLTKAIKWFKEAANDGDVFSEAILGYSYYTGSELSSEKDYDQAFIYLSRAIRNSDFDYLEDSIKASIYRSLAGSYRYGRGCESDQSLASYYTEQAAKYGDEGSKRATVLIRKDIEVDTNIKNNSKGSTATQQTSEKKSTIEYPVLIKPLSNNNWHNTTTPEALEMYNKGINERDQGNHGLAFEYFLKSYNSGCAVAGNELAIAYAYGRGVSKNIKLARHYIDLTLENFRKNNLVYPMGEGFWYVDVLDSKGEICLLDNDWDEASKIFDVITKMGYVNKGKTMFTKSMMEKLSIENLPINVKIPSNIIETSNHKWEVMSVVVDKGITYLNKRVTPKTKTTWVSSDTGEYIEDAQTGQKYYLIESTIGTNYTEKKVLNSKELTISH